MRGLAINRVLEGTPKIRKVNNLTVEEYISRNDEVIWTSHDENKEILAVFSKELHTEIFQ